ncbi:MAG: hypothetical protein K2Y18_02420 [Alphaproteobacteria bacterium]|nr:hypothetical protein [Alphaproteobacteria bacterium]
MDQLRKIFLKWSDNHPEKLHENAITGVDNAIREAFPCPKVLQK